MGGILRCVSCGEVHWNLRLGSRAGSVPDCRHCGSELRAEPRRIGRRFERLVPERRDVAKPVRPAGVGGGAPS